MVRAILDGRKTQTRRVIKYIPDLGDPDRWCHKLESVNAFCGDFRRYCPFGQPGDRLWVRETFRMYPLGGDPGSETYNRLGSGVGVDYKIPDSEGYEGCNFDEPDFCEAGNGNEKWRPSIHMPRWASRITLEVVDVRVERVQEISFEDAKAEGLPVETVCTGYTNWGNEEHSKTVHFPKLWNSINEKRGFGWDENPWVWVVEFKKGQGDDRP
jgi:hypothetical protein